MHKTSKFCSGWIGATISLALVAMIGACGVVTGTVPKDFPLPVYPGASVPIDGYHELMGGKSLILNSSTPIDVIHTYYVDKMRASGWSISADRKDGDMYSIYAQKGQDNAIVTLRPDAIILTWTTRKK